MDNKIFTDKVRVTVKAGDGGDGMNSFKAYKGKPACGPDGGDGGDGGSVYVVADENVHDLLAYRFTGKYYAENGERGGSNQCSGRRGKDVVLKVPCGTLVRDAESGKIICDVYEDGEKILLLAGGRGGKGNVRFTTARRHAPNFAQKGVKVKPHAVILEMKVIADVGLVGFPNVGKSTLLSKISAARPKIADYHFTTLSPNLGVVRYYENSFVVADIPGLIEGAAQGAGLGHDFLRHIERTRMICHVLDIAGTEGRDPLQDFEAINAELKAYSEKLAQLPRRVFLRRIPICPFTAFPPYAARGPKNFWTASGSCSKRSRPQKKFPPTSSRSRKRTPGSLKFTGTKRARSSLWAVWSTCCAATSFSTIPTPWRISSAC